MQLAEPLPVRVIAELLGVPADDHELLSRWSQAIVTMYEPGLDPERRIAAEAASAEFDTYLRILAADRAVRSRSDLISDLVAAPLTEDELVGTTALLLMAGQRSWCSRWPRHSTRCSTSCPGWRRPGLRCAATGSSSGGWIRFL
jgi:cytochrome P450